MKYRIGSAPVTEGVVDLPENSTPLLFQPHYIIYIIPITGVRHIGDGIKEELRESTSKK